MDKRAKASVDSTDSGMNRVLKHLKPDNQHEVEDWMPREVQTLLDLGNKQIQVLFASDKTYPDIEQDLTVSEYIGLTVISEIDKRPEAVCFTSNSKIHVFHTPYRNIKHIEFIRSQLRRDDLTFFTANGVHDALSLFLCKIRLRDRRVIDLQAMHMNLFFMRHYFLYRKTKIYGFDQLREHAKPSKPDLEQLVNTWFRVKLSLSYTNDELVLLRNSPHEVQAINVIKKRSALIRYLGLTIKSTFECRLREPAKAIYSLAQRADSKIREEFDRQGKKGFGDLVNTLGQCPAIEYEDQQGQWFWDPQLEI